MHLSDSSVTLSFQKTRAQEPARTFPYSTALLIFRSLAFLIPHVMINAGCYEPRVARANQPRLQVAAARARSP